MPKKGNWNDLPCPKCKEPVATNAEVCPHCGHRFTPAELKERKGAMKAGMIGCGVILLLAVLALAMCTSGDDDPPPAAEPGSATAEETAAVDAFREEIGTAMSKCDLAGQRLAERFAAVESGEGDVYAAYSAASFAYDACGQNSTMVRDVAIPDVLGGAAEDAAEAAIDACAGAMIAKRMMADTASEILDGDTRPSKVQEFSEDGDYVQLTMADCANGVLAVGTAAGVPIIREDQP